MRGTNPERGNEISVTLKVKNTVESQRDQLEEDSRIKRLFAPIHKLEKKEGVEHAYFGLCTKSGRIKSGYLINLNHAHYCAGDLAFKAGKLRLALRHFQHALNHWGEDFQAWIALGNCYSGLKQYRNAESSFFAALVFEKNDLVAKYNFGCSLMDQEMYQEALPVFLELPVHLKNVKINLDICQAKISIP